MSGLDIGILFLTLLGAWVGMKIGAVSAFFNILAGLMGSWAAARFYVVLLDHVAQPATAYIIVFGAVAGGFVFLGIVVSHLLETFFLGLIDKFLGGLLGISLSLVFSAAVLVPMLLNQEAAVRDLVRRSAFAPYLVRVTQKYFHITSSDIWRRLDPWLESPNVRRVRQLIERSR